ncbi:hypothetical protein BDV93DRAFT_117493 [Ceratobasidium sp. AG-I]|nr:hypothetical protein BDV93DRAFT_117493 [Ceratobasidium sp. AG-I]
MITQLTTMRPTTFASSCSLSSTLTFTNSRSSNNHSRWQWLFHGRHRNAFSLDVSHHPGGNIVHTRPAFRAQRFLVHRHHASYGTKFTAVRRLGQRRPRHHGYTEKFSPDRATYTLLWTARAKTIKGRAPINHLIWTPCPWRRYVRAKRPASCVPL